MLRRPARLGVACLATVLGPTIAAQAWTDAPRTAQVRLADNPDDYVRQVIGLARLLPVAG